MTTSAGPLAAGPLTLQVARSFAEAEKYREQWDELVAATGTDLYQTFDWCRLWWKYYGPKRELHLLLCLEDGTLVGVIPAFVETQWLGPAWQRSAKLVGSDYSLTLCNLAVQSQARPAALELSARYFLSQLRCDVVLFGPLTGPAAHIDDIVATGRALGDVVAEVTSRGDSCNTYFTLPATFEEYLKSLDKKQRSNFKRMSEQSAKNHRITFDVVSDPARILAEFDEFCEQHRAQWQPDGKLGHFGDWPKAREFNRELVEMLAARGLVRFHRILADDKVISSQYGYIFGQTIYWRLPARVRSAEWDRFSLGTLGLVRMIEACIAEGIRHVEAGRGHYGYKVHHGGQEYPLRTVQYVRRAPLVPARVKLFQFFAFLLDYGYYKILFVRFGRHLPFLQRPIWSSWIRSTG